tara:strand:- start:3171 stop:3989 length:819 start_codon:yes stop_codon:yes gene_type:complete
MLVALLSLLLILQPPPPPTNTHATVTVRTDVGWVGPSQSFNILVIITPDDGWHVYWKDSGASGAPTECAVTAPAGYKVGKPIFPRPTVFEEKEGATYGYDKQVAIFIPVTSPEHIHSNEATFEVNTFWLACKKICVIGEQENKLTLSANQTTVGPPHRDMQLVRWKKLLPKNISELKEAKTVLRGNTIQITGTTTKKQISFIGIEQPGVRFLESPVQYTDNDHFVLTVTMELDFLAANTDSIPIEGLLLVGSNDNDPCYVVQDVAKLVTNTK